MRRLLGLVRYLPGEAVTWALRNAEPFPVEVPPKPKKVDYEALQAMGGEVITIPKKAG